MAGRSEVQIPYLYFTHSFEYDILFVMISRHDHNGLVWVDVQSPTQDEVRSLMEEFELQAEVYRRQIRLAKELNLPMNVHCYDAHQENLAILRDRAIPQPDAWPSNVEIVAVRQ